MLPLSSITSLPVKAFVRSPQASLRLRTVMPISPARWVCARGCARASRIPREEEAGLPCRVAEVPARRSPPLASASPIEMSPGMRARPQQAEGLRACCVDLIKRQLGWLIKSGRVEGSSPPAGQFRWRGGGSELSCSVGRGPAECKDGRSARIAVEGRNEGCSGRKEDFGERAPRPKMFFGVASMCC
jgi:hypothetical protein